MKFQYGIYSDTAHAPVRKASCVPGVRLPLWVVTSRFYTYWLVVSNQIQVPESDSIRSAASSEVELSHEDMIHGIQKRGLSMGLRSPGARGGDRKCDGTTQGFVRVIRFAVFSLEQGGAVSEVNRAFNRGIPVRLQDPTTRSVW